jgi:hypothetical protein
MSNTVSVDTAERETEGKREKSAMERKKRRKKWKKVFAEEEVKITSTYVYFT